MTYTCSNPECPGEHEVEGANCFDEPSVEEKVRQTKARADADENYTNRCLHCNEKVFFVGHTHGLEKGHIYSELGASEYRISKTCEYCFDEMFSEPEYDDSAPSGFLSDDPDYMADLLIEGRKHVDNDGEN